MPNLANLDYVDRINRAVDHVTRNLAEPLRLEEVARAACFSPHHFHRIFRGLMGETLAAFVKRLRLERSLYLLSHRNGATLTEVALACGFSSSSDFSRSFRGHYGVSPRAFDLETLRRSRRQAMLDAVASLNPHHLKTLPIGDNSDGFRIRLRDLPARQVAYIRVTRAYEGGVRAAADRLIRWSVVRGLDGGQWLGYQWDDPELVPPEKCRYDVGVEVPAGTAGGGEVSMTEFQAMRVAELEIKGPIDLELRALHWIYLTWLPTSGFAPAHEPAFEAWNGRPFANGDTHFDLRVQLPVVNASTPI